MLKYLTKMGVILSCSSDTVQQYASKAEYSHVSTKSRGHEQGSIGGFVLSSASESPSSHADFEQSRTSIPAGVAYSFCQINTSTSGRGSAVVNSGGSNQSEAVTSPLRPVSAAKIKIQTIAEFYPEFKKMITGRLDDELEVVIDKKVIYVYHCAYHTDSIKERDELQNDVYPWLREYCRARGFSLEVIDLSWNLKDFHSCGHACRKLPLPIMKELLQNQSDCSIIVVMLNEKYGAYWIPLEIEEQDFNMIFKKVTEDEKEFMKKWYKFSPSLEPPSYILQAVELHCDKYSGSTQVFKEGLREWEKQHLRLCNIMTKAVPPTSNKMYHTSDIERDLEETVLSDMCQGNNVIYVHRKLTNMQLDDAMQYVEVENFVDVTSGHLNETAQAKLRSLNARIMEKVEEDRRIELEVPWLAMVNINSSTTKSWHSTPNARRPEYSQKRHSMSDFTRLEERLSQVQQQQQETEEKTRRRRSTVSKRRKLGTMLSTEVGNDAENSPCRDSHNSNRVENLKDRQIYLRNLGVAWQHMVKDMVDEAMVKLSASDATKTKMISRGLTEGLYTELLHHSKTAMDYRYAVLGQNEFVQQLESFVIKGNGGGENKSYPVLVHGGIGVGKTSLVSVLAANVFSLDKWKNCVCVMRFARASRNSMTIEQTVYSIAEQLCVVSGLHLRTISKYREKILHYLLNVTSPKVGTNNNILIIIDGLDQLKMSENSSFRGFSWLPKEVNGCVRFILTATSSSDVYKCVRECLSPNAHCMEIPRLFPADQFAMLTRFLHLSQRSISEETQKRICQQIQTSGSPLLIHIIIVCLVHYNSEDDLLSKLKTGSDVKTMINVLLGLLEKQFGVNYVKVLCCLLVYTKFGISQNEFIDMASCHDGICEETLVHDNYIVRRVPCLQWYAITSTLHPFLFLNVSHGIPLLKWKHVVFEEVCKKRYAQSITEIKQLLQNYWTDKLDPEDLAHVSKQSLEFAPGAFNGRFFDEILHSFKDTSKLQGACVDLLSAEFIQGLMKSCTTQAVIMELELFAVSEEISIIRNLIKRLEPALYTSKQSFLTHLYQYITFNQIETKTKFPVLNELYKTALQQLPPILMPLYGLGAFSFGYCPNEKSSKYRNTGIFRIKGDDEHVVVIAQNNNEVKIFNFHTSLNHRVLRDVEIPRDVQIINMFRAVILCDRELHIYDLDKGKLFSKLHGILNLRMPFFGIHDEDHTMAMSRNRMYVNMLHNITGQVVTTFKVGEDRFLNSLLVSENGEICVCGDEVQKPFPLLVWNLKHRQLIHDFRIRGHEFLTRMASITKNGHFVVTVCREVEDPEPNFLIAYDLQTGTMLTKLKPEHSCTAVKISQEAGIIASCHENGDVLVWSLGDSSVSHLPRYIMKGHTVGVDQLSLSDNGERGVSWDKKARDPIIWMWDFKQGKALGCIPSITGPSCCQMSADGNVVLAAFPNQENVHSFCVPGEQFVPNLQAVYGDSARKGKIFHVD